MDLARFDTRELAHEGVEVPLVIDGETIYGDDEQPVMFRIRGLADPEVHRILLASLRAGSSRTPEEQFASDMKLVRAAVIGWSDNWGIGNDADGKPAKVEFSKQNLEKVFGIPAIRRAVLAEIAKERHFMKGL